MERIYTKIYQLNVAHDFYQNGVSADFTFAPLGETTKQLFVHDLLFKHHPTGFDLAYKTQENRTGALEALEHELIFYVGIHLTNLNALNYTDLPEKENSTDIYFAEMDWADGETDLTTIQVRSTQFTELHQHQNEQLTLNVVNDTGQIIFSKTSTGIKNAADDDDLFNHEFNVQLPAQFALQTHTVELMKTANGAFIKRTEIFVYNPLAQANLFGIVQLKLDHPINAESPLTQAVLKLQALESKWIYEITLSKNYTAHSFQLFRPGLLEEDPHLLSFKQVSDDLETEINPEADAPNYEKDAQIYFISAKTIKESEHGIDDLNLVVLDDEEEPKVKIKGLPNPSLNTPNKKVYLKI